MKRTSVLISGASIAGPTLAYWLARRGAAVTVVEQAPTLRTGGHGVDFRGAQMELLDRMGITDEVRARETAMGTQTFVDATGRPIVEMPSLFFSGEVEIARGDLAQLLYERTRDDVEYVFGDSVTALTDTGDGVDVTFRRSPARRFDLVVGADGMHSAVRRLTFGEESRFATFRGYYAAGFEAPNHLGLDHAGLMYNEPGRAVMVGSGRDRSTLGVGLIFKADRLAYDRHDTRQVRGLVAEHYAGMGWEVPRLLDGLDRAADLYFDPLEQIQLDRWSTGRVALLGDAAYCPSPASGQGTSLALVGAHVLARELAAAGGDHETAFAAYETAMRPYVEKNLAFGRKMVKDMVPGGRFSIALRNYGMRTLKYHPRKEQVIDRVLRPLHEAATAITI
jgi:2-polyprenyl-6-methoxyphenol hydroxylase-like FAD-dependent oxidoreductase